MAILQGRARRMGRDLEIKDYGNHSGGLTTHTVQHAVRPDQIIDSLNMYLDRQTNVWRKRNGYTKDNSSAISATGIRGLFRHYGSTKFFVAANGTQLYKDNGAGVYASIGSGFANDVDWFFTGMEISGTYNTLGCNGNNDVIQKWPGTGTTAALGGSPPKGNFIYVHKNFVWIWSATSPQQIVYSDVSLPESYPANNFFNLKSPGAGVGVGLAVLDDALICFKADSIWRIVGSSNDDFRLETITYRVGCISPRTIVEGEYKGENVLYFLGKDRQVYILKGPDVIPVGIEVENTLNTIPAASLATTAGWFYKHDYYLAYRDTGTGSNNFVLVYDGLKGVWKGIYDWPLNCVIVLRGQGDTGQLYGGQSSNGFILNLDSGTTDAGTTIATRVRYRYETQDDPKRLKQYDVLWVAIEPFSGTLVVEITLDYNSTSTVLASQVATPSTSVFGTGVFGTATFGGQTFQLYKYRIPTPNKGYQCSVKLSNTDSNDTLYFYGYSLGYHSQNVRYTN